MSGGFGFGNLVINCCIYSDVSRALLKISQRSFRVCGEVSYQQYQQQLQTALPTYKELLDVAVGYCRSIEEKEISCNLVQ